MTAERWYLKVCETMRRCTLHRAFTACVHGWVHVHGRVPCRPAMALCVVVCQVEKVPSRESRRGELARAIDVRLLRPEAVVPGVWRDRRPRSPQAATKGRVWWRRRLLPPPRKAKRLHGREKRRCRFGGNVPKQIPERRLEGQGTETHLPTPRRVFFVKNNRKRGKARFRLGN